MPETPSGPLCALTTKWWIGVVGVEIFPRHPEPVTDVNPPAALETAGTSARANPRMQRLVKKPFIVPSLNSMYDSSSHRSEPRTVTFRICDRGVQIGGDDLALQRAHAAPGLTQSVRALS